MSFFLLLGAFGVVCLAGSGWCLYRAGIQRGLEIALEGAPFTRRIPMRRLILLLAIAALTGVAAVGPATSTAAFGIAAVLMVIFPFIPFKQFKLSGATMAAVTFVVAALVAVVAAFFSGDLTSANFNLKDLVVAAGALWAITQGVFQLFKDNPTVGPLLTDAPKPAAPPAPPAA